MVRLEFKQIKLELEQEFQIKMGFYVTFNDLSGHTTGQRRPSAKKKGKEGQTTLGTPARP